MTEKPVNNAGSVEQIVFSKEFLSWSASDIISLVRKLNRQEIFLLSARPDLHPLRLRSWELQYRVPYPDFETVFVCIRNQTAVL